MAVRGELLLAGDGEAILSDYTVAARGVTNQENVLAARR